MKSRHREYIDQAFQACMEGRLLEKSELLPLLEMDPDSEDALYLCRRGLERFFHGGRPFASGGGGVPDLRQRRLDGPQRRT